MIAAGDPNGSIAAFVRSAGFEPHEIVDSIQFAYDPAVQTALADLVVGDIKRATTALYRWYDAGAERLPVAGDLFVVLDGAATPRCVCRMESVEVVPFERVDEDFAYTEGEGDRTLASWREIHRTFFEEEARAGGFEFNARTLVVLQRFHRLA